MMTWFVFGAVALAVCGWTVAAGLYLQLKDALGLLKEKDETAELWREIANAAWGDVVRERHLAEFAVRAMDPAEPFPTMEELNEWRAARGHIRVVDDA